MKKINLFEALKAKGITLDEGEKKMLDEVSNELNAALDAHKSGAMSDEDFNAKLEAKKADLLQGLPTGEALTELKAAFEAQGLALKSLQEQGAPQKSPTLLEMITKSLEDHKEQLDGLRTTKSTTGGFVMEIKASNSTITTGYASSSPNTYLPVPTFMPGFHQSPEVAVTIMDLVDMGTSTSPTITWVNEQPIEGDAGWTAEGALKSQVAWKYTSETASAKKVTAFVKVTDESLKDIPFLANRIFTRLRELILRKMQDGIINGDGSSNSPLGIVDQSPAYTTNSFDDSVKSPTTADALMAMAGQIDELEYDTDNLVAVMNGVDIRKMKWEKDDNNNYIIPPFTTQNGTYVDNMRVVKNNKITKGDALVGDLKRFMVLMVDGLTIEIGLDGNDFTYNLRTIRGEARLITAVSDNDLGAFVYDTIATVKAEIDSTI